MNYQLAEYRAAGMDGHVAKPINAGILFSALDEVATSRDESVAA